MANYKSPAVLNPPLIGVMVLSIGIPIAAYVFYYNAQVRELERLENQEQQERQELTQMLSVIDELDGELLKTRKSEAIVQHFMVRFIRSVADARRFLEREPARIISEVDDLEVQILGDLGEEYTGRPVDNYPYEGEISNYFRRAFVRQFQVEGPFTSLQEFLERLSHVTWQAYYPRAAYVDVTLPQGVELPDFHDEVLREDILHDPNGLPLFFERVDDSPDPERMGRLWFLCRPLDAVPGRIEEERNMTDEQKRQALNLATGHDQWETAIETLQTFIAQRRPMVEGSLHYSQPEDDGRMTREVNYCETTGLPLLAHDFHPFFFIDSFEFQTDDFDPNRHRIQLRIVVPILEAGREEILMQGVQE